MKWSWMLLLAATTMAVHADELHLRDGTVVVGAYVGGTTKEIYFQRTPAGSDMYPLFLVESVKFNSVPSLTPGAALKSGPRGVAASSIPVRPAARTSPASAPVDLAARIKWVFALFLPPPLTVPLAHPAH